MRTATGSTRGEDVDRLYRIVALRELGLIKEMTMPEHYSEAQRKQLAQRREALGDEGMAKAQQDWTDVIADANAALAAGLDPSSPEAQAIVARWDGLVERFTGGDAGIRQSLQQMYSAEGVEKASRGAVSVELQEFLGRARARGRRGRAGALPSTRLRRSLHRSPRRQPVMEPGAR